MWPFKAFCAMHLLFKVHKLSLHFGFAFADESNEMNETWRIKHDLVGGREVNQRKCRFRNNNSWVLFDYTKFSFSLWLWLSLSLSVSLSVALSASAFEFGENQCKRIRNARFSMCDNDWLDPELTLSKQNTDGWFVLWGWTYFEASTFISISCDVQD